MSVQPTPSTSVTPIFKRILLKLSGEALAGEKGFGYDFDTVNRLADEVVSVKETGATLGLVIGGAFVIAVVAGLVGVVFYLYCRYVRPGASFFKKQTLTRSTPTLVPDE